MRHETQALLTFGATNQRFLTIKAQKSILIHYSSLLESSERFPKGESAAVEDLDEHLSLLDDSLINHSGEGIYERIFGKGNSGFKPEDVHSNTRFVVISHDRADSTPASVLRNEGPIFNYGNSAGNSDY